jgi:hypothetical protein
MCPAVFNTFASKLSMELWCKKNRHSKLSSEKLKSCFLFLEILALA